VVDSPRHGGRVLGGRELVFTVSHDAPTATVWMSGTLAYESGASLCIALATVIDDRQPLVLDVTGLDDIDPVGEEILAQCVADALWRRSDVRITTGDAPAWMTPIRRAR
jgi:hypothetical protein